MIRQGVVCQVDSFVRDHSASWLPASDSGSTAAHPENHYQVLLDPLSGCGSCASAGGCGVQLIPTSQADLQVTCVSAFNARVSVGDRVNVRIQDPDSHWLGIVFRAYGFPTAGMIIGTIVGYQLGNWLLPANVLELAGLLGFFVGLTGGLIAWSRSETSTRNESLRFSRVDSATIVGVVANSGEVI